MAESFQQKLNGLSPVERLKATDKYLTEMRGILSSMDEIIALREKRGEAPSDEFGGYRRSTVLKFIGELEKQKASILAEIEREERKNSEREERLRAERAKLAEEKRSADRAAALPPAQAQENNRAISELSKKMDSMAITPQDSAVTSFKKGDSSLALESMYTGLSMDIEKMRDDILQEMKYSYKQDMAIYDDLSEKIEAIKKTDSAALEETLKPMGENIDAMNGSLVALDEKISAMQPVDYDAIADRVAAKVVSGGIDYDILAERIVGIMTGGAVPQNAAAELSAMDRKIDDLKSALNGAVNVKQMPEFKKLDALIAEYLRAFSYDIIPDMLITANLIKDQANRYIVSGNALRGETMLSDLRVRLTRVNVWGADAVAAVSDAVEAHNLGVTYSKEAMQAFGEASREFEQSPALPEDELAQKLLRAKKLLFCDADMEAMDRETLAEMLEIREETEGSVPDEGKVANLTELKKELMSFNLSYFIDLTPALPEEKDAPVSSVDTQVILDAIARIGTSIASATPAEEDAEDVRIKLEKLSKIEPSVSVKKPKILRPAVSAKDNKVEKTDQPLRTVRRSLKTVNDNSEALSKKLVDELAIKIANSRVK